MSVRHPIIAVTGSSGSGTSTVQDVFTKIFLREKINPVLVHGNSFRRFTPEEVVKVFNAAAESGHPISHFGPEANHLDRLEGLFREYSRSATGLMREYISNDELVEIYQQAIGTYTPWREIPEGSDCLFYEGQHGGCIEETWTRREMSPSHNPFVVNVRHRLTTRSDFGVDVPKWVDLLIGVVPSINLEWIQKIHRDCIKSGTSAEAVIQTILHRMPDYVRYITPQFSLTDINFQRVPLVDTSNPFVAIEVPSLDESMVVIRFRNPKKFDFPFILSKLHNSFMSRPNTIVVPGGDMEHAMNLICAPLVCELVEKMRKHQRH